MSASEATFSGTLARSAPAFPGPVTVMAASVDDRAWMAAAASATATGGWIALEPGSPAPDGRRVAEATGLVRIARASEDDGGYRRLVVTNGGEARELAERLAKHPAAARALADLSGVSAIRLAAWTAEELHAGRLRILWRKRTQLVVGATPAAAPAPVAPRRTPAPVAPSQPTPQYSTFPPEADAAAIAGVLQDAARDGVPFCEECMKAAAPEYSTFPPDIDALAAARVLIDAAIDGVPFCEECMAAQSAETA
jgi:hypothetical protein